MISIEPQREQKLRVNFRPLCCFLICPVVISPGFLRHTTCGALIIRRKNSKNSGNRRLDPRCCAPDEWVSAGYRGRSVFLYAEGGPWACRDNACAPTIHEN